MKTTNISFRKAALPVFGVLLAAIIALTSVTYAWFTSGTTATVQPINVGVEAAGGLQFAIAEYDDQDVAQPFSWKSSLDLSDLIGDVTLTPASSNGVASDDTNGARTLAFYQAKYNDTFDKISDIQTIDDTNEDRAGYIKFDLYFRNPELSAKDITLTGTTVTSLAGQSNLAVRVAFISQAEVSSANQDLRPSSFAPGSPLNANATIYEPNATTHLDGTTTKHDYKAVVGQGTSSAMYDRFTGDSYTAETTTREYSASADYTSKFVFDSTSAGGTTKFRAWKMADDFTLISPNEAATQKADGKVIYVRTNTAEQGQPEVYTFAVQSGDIQASGVDYCLFTPVKLYTKATTTNVLSDNIATEESTSETFFKLNAQTITKVTVYIWLEGQDSDCTNIIAGYQFSANLSFEAKVNAQN